MKNVVEERQALPEEVRKALGYIGSIKTPKKAASSAANGKMYGGRRTSELKDIPCTCGAGESLQHKSTCPRGRAIRRREKAGLPLL